MPLRARLIEAQLLRWTFPESVWAQSLSLAAHGGDDRLRRALELSFREWLICRAYGDRKTPCPSRLVAQSWVCLRRDRDHYRKFRRASLRACSEEQLRPCLNDPTSEEFLALKKAWNRSKLSREKAFSASWTLDHRFEIPEPWGLAPEQVRPRHEKKFTGGNSEGGYPNSQLLGGPGI